jgi:hypothetical protein
VREVERARVLLSYAQGSSISEIQRQFGVSRPINLWGLPWAFVGLGARVPLSMRAEPRKYIKSADIHILSEQ